MTADPSMNEPVAWLLARLRAHAGWNAGGSSELAGEAADHIEAREATLRQIEADLVAAVALMNKHFAHATALQTELETVKGERDALAFISDDNARGYASANARADRSEALIRELVEALRKLLAAAEAAADIASDHADWEQVAYQYGDAVLCSRTLVEKQP